MIAVVGLDTFGLELLFCLARLGQEVVGIDSDERKVRQLACRGNPFFEPGLDGEPRQNGNGFGSHRPLKALESPECVMICVGIASVTDGTADLSAVMAVADTIGDQLQRRAVIALRSTVPVGTAAMVEERINARLDQRDAGFEVSVVANPEFLRTGRAIEDFLRLIARHPGATPMARRSRPRYLTNLYRRLLQAPASVLDARSASCSRTRRTSHLALRHQLRQRACAALRGDGRLHCLGAGGCRSRSAHRAGLPPPRPRLRGLVPPQGRQIADRHGRGAR